MLGLEIIVTQRADLRSPQLDYRVSDEIKHAANLLVLAFMQDDFVPRVVFSLTNAANFCRSGSRTVVKRNPAPQAFDRLLFRKTLYLRLVDFLHLVASGANEVCEVAV